MSAEKQPPRITAYVNLHPKGCLSAFIIAAAILFLLATKPEPHPDTMPRTPQTNAELLEAAKEAVRNYHSDTSVPLADTAAGLESIISDAQIMLDATNNDIAADDE